MKTIFYTLLLSLIISFEANAQTNIFPSTGAAGIGTTTPNASSLLEIKSTKKGLLIPRMTKNQRDAIAIPATGLLIYQTNSTPGFYYYSGSAWKALTTKAGWSLTGNAGTDSSINFIGTTDAHSLVFKVNNLQAGLIDYSTYNTGRRNTAFGQIALYSNTSGIENTATGYGSLYTNTSGNYNSAYGKYALFNNNADNNTALGYNTMFFNTTGVNNTATGSVALQNNTTGQQNTANGYAALYSNNNGSYNSASGGAALNSNTSGSWNTANGAYSMYLNTTSYYNTATGGYALYSNKAGNSNTANGYNALYNNTANNNTAIGTTALYTNTTGTDNTAAGLEALHFNTTGYQNTAVGIDALLANTTGYKNTSVGDYALSNNEIGAYNTAVGNYALDNNTSSFNTAFGNGTLHANTTGFNNTAIGNGADVSASNLQNATAIGSGAIATADNQVMLGNTSVTSVKAAGSFVIYSDGRFKKNLKENVPGLTFINQLKPVTYNYDIRGLNNLMAPSSTQQTKNVLQKINDAAISAKENILYTGFVAQDVETAAKKINYDFSGVYKPQNNKDAYGLSYADFVVPLVKAVQELSKMNDDKDAKIDNLQKQIDDLKALIVAHQSSAVNQQSTNISSASLQQNIPNPFNHSTTISYIITCKIYFSTNNHYR